MERIDFNVHWTHFHDMYLKVNLSVNLSVHQVTSVHFFDKVNDTLNDIGHGNKCTEIRNHVHGDLHFTEY